MCANCGHHHTEHSESGCDHSFYKKWYGGMEIETKCLCSRYEPTEQECD